MKSVSKKIDLTNSIWGGNLQTVKFLVKEGADIHQDNDRALRWAASCEDLFEIVKFLVESGADIHALGDEALSNAAEAGHFEAVKFLVSKGADINAAIDNDCMMWVLFGGYFDVAKFLIENGANWKGLPGLNFSSKEEALKYLELMTI